MRIERSPSAEKSTAARRLRPISRWISWDRPSIRPLRPSRSVLVWVLRGSIAYSAVTHPNPPPLRKGGTRSSTVAEQSTLVSPVEIMQLPSG